MKIAFIGDIVGRPGREMLSKYLKDIKKEYEIDFVIANYENASHGFGLTPKNANELFSYGVDCMTGGNHSWDKKEISTLFETHEILRPYNYPDGVAGRGYEIYKVANEKLAVINLMGHFSMPYVDNAFRKAKQLVNQLQEDGVTDIFIDFHAEASSEKRAMMMMLEGQISAMIGTHTHVSTDDLQISNGTLYLTDIGLTGCRNNIIGMDKKNPIKQFLTGMRGHYDVPKKCKKILQLVVMDIQNGKCVDGFKLKYFDNNKIFKTNAWIED